jgi:integrase/recombinase XerD
LSEGDLVGVRAVRVPVGQLAYWTVFDDGYRPVAEVDRFLRHLRFGRGRTEGTSQAYARSLALFVEWKGEREWLAAARELDRFVLRLRTTPVEAGRARGRARSPQRINAVLVAVRELYRHAVADGRVPAAALAALFEVADDRFWPSHLQAESGQLTYVARPRHGLRVGRASPKAATGEEIEGLLGAASSARDRLLVGLPAITGVRIGAALSLRRSNVHLVEDARALGCETVGPHLHVPGTDTGPGITTKGAGYTVPAPPELVALFEFYTAERMEVARARTSDWVFVNLFAEPLGARMSYQTVYELYERLSRRAGLSRRVTPHMLRHGVGTHLASSGVSLAVIQRVLGHAQVTSTQVYARPDERALRAAVEAGAARLRRTTGTRP